MATELLFGPDLQGELLCRADQGGAGHTSVGSNFLDGGTPTEFFCLHPDSGRMISIHILFGTRAPAIQDHKLTKCEILQ